MSEHHGTVTIKAPVEQVYTFFTHFNDFPKFMHFVKEVTYYDDQRSHWVAQAAGTREWDAVNEDWIPNQQIGWRSTRGLENTGRVKFMPLNAERTQVDVYIAYTPPAGVLGEVVEHLGFDSRFDAMLKEDLDHFARMVELAPAGALDPMQSHYLFHDQSALSQGSVTPEQVESMGRDPMMQSQALQEREAVVAREREQAQQSAQERASRSEQQLAQQRQAVQQQEMALQQQAELDRQAAQLRSQEQITPGVSEPHPVYDTLGGRNAATERVAIGDQDGRSQRFPGHEQDPMLSRAPGRVVNAEEPTLAEMELESPWGVAIHGQRTRDEEEEPLHAPLHEDNQV